VNLHNTIRTAIISVGVVICTVMLLVYGFDNAYHNSKRDHQVKIAKVAACKKAVPEQVALCVLNIDK
jgi:hypothetical protein